MFSPATTVELTDELRELQRRWKLAGLDPGGVEGQAEQDRLYVEEIGPLLVPLFAALPLHGAPERMEPLTGLVSVVGRAWQPAALMAAWVKPRRLLLLRTREPTDDGPSTMELVSRFSGVPLDRIEHQWVAGSSELAVYQEVREFLGRNELRPEQVAIDVSGGKKSMSVAAALCGFLAGTRLVYVDYEEHDPLARAPVPGTEYPRLIANPLEIFGDLEIDRIREAFNGGRYVDAARRAEDLSKRLYEPLQAEACRLMCLGYGAWHRFDFAAAGPLLEQLRELVDRHTMRTGWEWIRDVRARLDGHLELLDQLTSFERRPDSVESGAPMILNHLAAASRALDQEDLDDAAMLLYATVERYVDVSLWEIAGLHDQHPDYDKLEGVIDWDRFHKVGELLFESYHRRPPKGPILYRSGVHLLAALDPARIGEGDIGWLRGLGAMRNALAHGLVPTHPSAEEVRNRLAKVRDLLGRGLGGDDQIGRWLDRLRFPDLQAHTTTDS